VRGPARWVLVAFLLTVAYAVYLQPEWEPVQDDQADFAQLAEGIASRGEFTRALPGDPFLAEPHRRPGYPLFVAAVCDTVGCGHWQVAIAQAALYAATVALTFVIAVEVVGRPTTAAMLTALYLPIAYYAALELSEVLAAFLFMLALALYLRARVSGSAWALACGAASGLLALTRPLFILLPLLFVGIEGIAVLARRGAIGPAARLLAGVILGAALIEAPFLVYSFVWFHSPLLSTSGTVLWAGYLQGKTSGSAADLDRFKEAALSGSEDSTVVDLGRAISLDAVESREAAGAFRDAAIFEAAPDQRARVAAFVVLNQSLDDRALRLVAHDPVGYLLRGFTVRTPALWATDVPVRVSQVAALPLVVRIALFVFEFVLFAGAIGGAVLLLRSRALGALVVTGAFVYVWFLSLPFLSEGRYAIPVRPVMAILLVPMIGRFLLRGSPGGVAGRLRIAEVDSV
jgi:hypothetical protein